MHSPKISVIVPVYNAEKYLRRCVDSILAQTFTDFELLLIDDGSKDCSGAICDEYAAMDSRVRVFHQPNGGVSSARNLGLDNAKGEWIAFVDSDDWVAPEYLDVLSSTKSDLTLSYYKAIGWKEWVNNPYKDKDYTFTELSSFFKEHMHTPMIWAALFRLKLLNDNVIRFDESISYGEDSIFMVKYMSVICSAATRSTATYYYNCTNQDSASYSFNDINKYLRFVDIFSKELHRLNSRMNADITSLIYGILGERITHMINIAVHCNSLSSLRMIRSNSTVISTITSENFVSRTRVQKCLYKLFKSNMLTASFCFVKIRDKVKQFTKNRF